ncbi:MAG: ABC transporter ATP-binding protein [Myxococcales bacterium]|nr:ABC transporter ATP-binding protein [Myxococcales bacterium]
MIRVRGMRKAYRTGKVVNEVLRGVDFVVEAGEFVSIIGPSGSGKSTLLHAIGGLDRDYTGTIEVDGRDLHSLSDTALSDYRNRSVGFVFQSFYLLPHLSILENVALPAVFARSGERLDHAAASARARDVLEQVELGARTDSTPTMLSGGQRQRVAIARALFHRPALLLCDEPTGNLDSKMGAQIIELFRRLNADAKITVMIVTHDPRISAATTRTLRVEDGNLFDEGTHRPTAMPEPATPEAPQ